MMFKSENQTKHAKKKADVVPNNRSTDIIVTMGPEADDKNKIMEMLHAGMDIARFELTSYN